MIRNYKGCTEGFVNQVYHFAHYMATEARAQGFHALPNGGIRVQLGDSYVATLFPGRLANQPFDFACILIPETGRYDVSRLISLQDGLGRDVDVRGFEVAIDRVTEVFGRIYLHFASLWFRNIQPSEIEAAWVRQLTLFDWPVYISAIRNGIFAP